MLAWVSDMAEGSEAMACRMSLAALSTASSIERACPSADSAAWKASTKSVCFPLSAWVASITGRADVAVGKRQPLPGAGDIAGDRSQCRFVEFVVQFGHPLGGRVDAAR